MQVFGPKQLGRYSAGGHPRRILLQNVSAACAWSQLGLHRLPSAGHACIPVQVKLEVFPVGQILGVSVLADGMKGSGLSSLL